MGWYKAMVKPFPTTPPMLFVRVLFNRGQALPCPDNKFVKKANNR